MKQIYLFKKGFVIFLKGATFSDFIDTRLLTYITSFIQNRFPLFWRIYFQLGSNLIKYIVPSQINTNGLKSTPHLRVLFYPLSQISSEVSLLPGSPLVFLNGDSCIKGNSEYYQILKLPLLYFIKSRILLYSYFFSSLYKMFHQLNTTRVMAAYGGLPS